MNECLPYTWFIHSLGHPRYLELLTHFVETIILYFVMSAMETIDKGVSVYSGTELTRV